MYRVCWVGLIMVFHIRGGGGAGEAASGRKCWNRAIGFWHIYFNRTSIWGGETISSCNTSPVKPEAPPFCSAPAAGASFSVRHLTAGKADSQLPVLSPVMVLLMNIAVIRIDLSEPGAETTWQKAAIKGRLHPRWTCFVGSFVPRFLGFVGSFGPRLTMACIRSTARKRKINRNIFKSNELRIRSRHLPCRVYVGFDTDAL